MVVTSGGRPLTRISQGIPSREGGEPVFQEAAQFLAADSVLKHTEVDKSEQTPEIASYPHSQQEELEKCGLKALTVSSEVIWASLTNHLPPGHPTF